MEPAQYYGIADVVADWTPAGVVATELYNMTGVVASMKGVFDLRLENLASSKAHDAEMARLRTMLIGHFA